MKTTSLDNSSTPTASQTTMAHAGAIPSRISYIDGKTLVHVQLHEGPELAPTVTDLFSIPKKHLKYAHMLHSHSDLMRALKASLAALEKLERHLEDMRASNPGYLGKLCLQDYGLMNEAYFEQERAIPMARAAIALMRGIPLPLKP